MSTPMVRANPTLIRVMAAVVPLAVGQVLALFRDYLSQAVVVLVLVLVVVAAASFGDRAAGILAALSSAIWFDFHFTAPFHSLAMANAVDIELALLLVLVGVAVTEIALWGRRQHAALSLREGYIDGVLAASDPSGSELTTPEAIATRLARVLGVDQVRWVAGPPANDAAILNRDGSVSQSGVDLHAARSGLPTDRFLAIPVLRDGGTVGHFRISAATAIVRPTPDQLKVAVLLAEQAGHHRTPAS